MRFSPNVFQFMYVQLDFYTFGVVGLLAHLFDVPLVRWPFPFISCWLVGQIFVFVVGSLVFPPHLLLPIMAKPIARLVSSHCGNGRLASIKKNTHTHTHTHHIHP